MKQPVIFLKKNLLLLIAVLTAVTAMPQNQKDKYAAIKKIIEAKQYVFTAQTVLPLSAKVRQLTSVYQLNVNGDTIQADLPYFGRAYTAPVDPSQGGIHFTSTDFDYSAIDKKKGGWTISIKPKDNTEARQLTLDVSVSGNASLQVISNNRQPISFNGYISERKK